MLKTDTTDAKEKVVKTKRRPVERKSKSRFVEKYQERILSIRESDEKAAKRKQAKIKSSRKTTKKEDNM